MGLIVDINHRISIELRRESAILYVEGASDVEYDYADIRAITVALKRIAKSERCAVFMHAQRAAAKADTDKTLAAFPPGSLKL